MRLLPCRAALLALAIATNAAVAQTGYPSQPIKLIVPYPAGSLVDVLGRSIGETLTASLRQPVIVDNKPGASTLLGAKAVATAPPDGYTLLCGTQLNYSITHLVFKKSAFDPRALVPVSVLATYPLIVIARAGLAASNLPDFIALARADPGKITYGHQGKGNTGHLLGELLMLRGNFRMTEIPYRGSAPAIHDLFAGNIDMVCDYLLANKPNIDSGKLKMLGTAGRERLKGYPQVAALAETLPGVYADTWMGVAAPPGTPKELVTRISDALGRAFAMPELRQRILALEAEPLGSTPEQMREIIKSSTQLWGPVVEAAKIVVE